jgi:hypothetical protein
MQRRERSEINIKFCTRTTDKAQEYIYDPLAAEALALRDGVIFAKLRGYPNVVMETDCLEIVNLWNTRPWHQFFKK